MTTENSQTLTQLMQDVATLLNKDSVDPDTAMAELGVDSLNVVELILICEQIYTDVVDPESLQFDEYTTLREMDARLTTAA
ncbi:acyl carrier protein [Marinobacteraceae bacterium S3BR75-40.1]